jgi:HEPN domain-containing protein
MSAPEWNPPLGLWSLWDMEEFPAVRLMGAVKMATDVIHTFHRAIDQRGPTAGLSSTETLMARGILETFASDCDQLGLAAAASMISNALFRLHPNVVGGQPCNLQLVQSDLHNIRLQALRDLDRYKFLYLDKAEQGFYAQDGLFGSEVYGAFKNARDDIAEAGNCYALGRHTAAVFHSMRVVEHGLRALAAEVKISFGTDQWAVVIKNIEAQLKDYANNGIPGITDKAAKAAKLQFLSEAAAEFRYFKDAWRNYVSHGNDSYDALQAKSVLNHTGEFMRGLSRELREAP